MIPNCALAKAALMLGGKMEISPSERISVLFGIREHALCIDKVRELRAAQKAHLNELLKLVIDKPRSRKQFTEWEKGNHAKLEAIHRLEDEVDALLAKLDAE